jgi:trehalose 6-phosphate synthase/phosphatase
LLYYNVNLYNPPLYRCEHKNITKNLDIYFINYKNSVNGVGGVGTVSRDLIKLHPEIRFVFWDGSISSREIDLGVIIGGLDHNKVHKLYFKKYMWAALHGLSYSVSNAQLCSIRNDLVKEADQVARYLTQPSIRAKHCTDKVYWLNDYTSIALVGKVRDLNMKSTIVFSFRTPFGVKNAYPQLYSEDLPIFKGLLKADIITFHRQIDLDFYSSFIKDNYSDKLMDFDKVNDSDVSIVQKSGFIQRLMVVPMGNNKEYRQRLLLSNDTINISEQTLSQYKDVKIILSISRFEKTKGIEYEIKLIDKLLEEYPNLRNRFVFLRYTYRSKNKVDDSEYSKFHEKIMTSIERVSLKHGSIEWIPIVYKNDKKLNDAEVTGLLSASDILLIASFSDGFNHLSLEAIHSQQNGDNIQLVLSDIGASDYLDGYQPLSFDLKRDVEIMHDTIMRNPDDISNNYKDLEKSANKLSSRRWIDTILDNASKVVDDKKKGCL